MVRQAADGQQHSGAAGMHPEVVLVDGDDASGLAAMIAGLLEENVKEFRSRAAAARLARGRIVLEASDRGMAVTLSFGPGRVLVSDGAAGGAPVVAGDWLAMAKLCSGQASMVGAVLHGQARVRGRKGLAALPAATFALTVPRSFYEEREGGGGSASRGGAAADGAAAPTRWALDAQRAAWAGAGVSVAAVAVVVCVRRARTRRAERTDEVAGGQHSGQPLCG